LLVLLGPVSGDDNRDFFSKPETPRDFWRRVQFEIEVGKLDFAAQYLKGMLGALGKLKADDANAELLKIEEKEGISTFLRLRNVPEQLDRLRERQAQFLKDEKQRDKVLLEIRTARKEMRADVNKLIDMVTEALHKERAKFRDPNLIQKFINNLTATPEERAFAINQLQKSRESAVTYLLQALQKTHGSVAHEKIYTAMLKLDHIAPAMIAALHVKDDDVRRDILSYIKDRDLVGAIPELWYVTASTRFSEPIRAQAARTIAALKHVETDTLPPAKLALTKLAETYYQHKVRFPTPQIVVWSLDEKKNQIVDTTLDPSQAEEYYGLRYARFALDLDPAYKPAQVVFLSLALEKAYGSDIHLPLKAKAPQLKQLMTTVSPELLADVLSRALHDRRLPVILGAVQALGDLRDVRAGRPTTHGEPVLARALTYPDRRVQMAAAQAIIRIPGKPAPATAARVVDVFRRILLADTKSKVLIAYTNETEADMMRRIIVQAGFDAVLVKTRVEALDRLKRAADIDLILMSHAFPSAQEFAFTLSEMRADMDAGLLPLILTAPQEREARLRRFVARYPNTWVEVVDFDMLAGLQVERRVLDDIGNQMAQLREKLPQTKVLEETVALIATQWFAIRDGLRDLKTEKEAIAKLVQDLTKIKTLLKEDKTEKEMVDRVIKRLGDLVAEKEKNTKTIDQFSDIRNRVRGYIRDALGRPLSGAEWTVFKEDAFDALGRMARGTLKGYDIRPAEDAIQAMFRSTQVAYVKDALPIIARLPGAAPQRELATFVLDPMRDKLRDVAAAELAGNIQRNGLLLSRDLVARIKDLFATTADAKLKEQLTLVIGSMRPSATSTGRRLKDYQPAPAKEKAPEKEPEKEKAPAKEKAPEKEKE
jgi:CheY-like chemotaxis protein